MLSFVCREFMNLLRQRQKNVPTLRLCSKHLWKL